MRLQQIDYDYLVRLTPPADADDSAPSVFKKIHPLPEHEYYRVQVGPYVGRIGLPSGESIDIRSRFSFEDLVELFRRSRRFPAHVDVLASVEDSGRFLVDALVFAFVREVEHLAGRGLVKTYMPVRRTEPPYAGRLDAPSQLRELVGRPDRLVIRGRVLTVDGAENRVLRRAYDLLRGVQVRPLVERRLARLGPVLAPIDTVDIKPWDVEAIPRTALNRRYEAALELAVLVLRSRALVPQGFGFAGSSLLFYMPSVWQAFVEQWVMESWPRQDVRCQHAFRLTGDGSKRGIADVTVQRGERVVALYDAKYKEGASAPSNEDIYQMVTYCECLDVDEAFLVYPGTFEPRSVQVGRRRLRVIGLMPRASGIADDFA